MVDANLDFTNVCLGNAYCMRVQAQAAIDGCIILFCPRTEIQPALTHQVMYGVCTEVASPWREGCFVVIHRP